MSLRRAIIHQLRVQVPALGGRVYQAFLAPTGFQTPYATVKFAGEQSAVNIGFAGSRTIEVYLYRSLDSFVALDALQQEVIRILNGTTVTDVESGLQFILRWTGSAGDVIDEERKLVGVVVSFNAPTMYEIRR